MWRAGSIRRESSTKLSLVIDWKVVRDLRLVDWLPTNGLVWKTFSKGSFASRWRYGPYVKICDIFRRMPNWPWHDYDGVSELSCTLNEV